MGSGTRLRPSPLYPASIAPPDPLGSRAGHFRRLPHLLLAWAVEPTSLDAASRARALPRTSPATEWRGLCPTAGPLEGVTL
jgi:hypothetical protein